MATQTARALAISDGNIAKVYSAGFLVEGTTGGVFSGEAVWLSSDVSGTGDWYFELNGHQITSVSLPHLESVSAYLDFGSNQIASISAPVLTQILYGGDFSFYYNPISSVSVPVLSYISGRIDLRQSSPRYGNFHSVSFPSLSRIGDGTNVAYIQLTKNASLFEVNMPLLSVAQNCVINIDGCALTTDSVNNLLIRLNSARVGSLIFVDLSGGTSAAPTGAGLSAKTAMTNAGCTVTTN